MTYDNRFDGESLLDLSKSILLNASDAGLMDNDSIILMWEKLPTSSLSELRKWEHSNRRSISGKDVDFQYIEGTYRSVKVEAETKNGTGYIYHTFAKGLYTALDWTSARILKIENNPEQDGFAANDYQSEEGENYLTIEFPYIDPMLIKTVSESLPDEKDGITIDGKEFTGIYHRIISAPLKTETGDFSLRATYAKPQFVVDAFESFGTIDENISKYLWGVPKRLVEAVLDQWKTDGGGGEGRSARVSYGKQGGLADITLIDHFGSSDDASILYETVVAKDCASVSTSWHYFGLKQSEIEGDTYALDYKVDDIPVYNYGITGHTVKKYIRSSGNGKFDIVITDESALYQHLAEVIVSDGELNTVSEEQHLRCRRVLVGEDYVYQNDSDVTLEIPEEHTTGNPTIKVDYRVNADCTRDIVIHKTTFNKVVE